MRFNEKIILFRKSFKLLLIQKSSINLFVKQQRNRVQNSHFFSYSFLAVRYFIFLTINHSFFLKYMCGRNWFTLSFFNLFHIINTTLSFHIVKNIMDNAILPFGIYSSFKRIYSLSFKIYFWLSFALYFPLSVIFHFNDIFMDIYLYYVYAYTSKSTFLK